MEAELSKIFDELLKKHSEIIPDFWSEVDSENLYAACKSDYREFSRPQKDIPKEELSEAVSEKIGHYQHEISKHKKRFIEARVKAGDEGQRVLIKQEDGTLSHASKINRNEYEGRYRLNVSELSIKIDFLKSLFKEPKPPPEAFGPELLEVVRKALEGRKSLKEGVFIGKSYQVKALYNVLKERNYILGIEYPDKKFASWFLKNFNFRITDRTLRSLESKGQVEEEGHLKLLIK